MVASRRAKIEKQKQEEIAQIEEGKKDKIKQLDVKHSTSKLVKKPMSYLAISILVLLFSIIFLNDLCKLAMYFYDRCLKKQAIPPPKQSISDTFDEIKEEDEIVEKMYSKYLEEKLSRVHARLLEQKAMRLKKNNEHFV